MTERFFNPVPKWTTDTLKTLPGARLYFYENGTTTLKTIYADPFRNDELSNPVVADAAGIFEPIFLDGTYRVELKNSAGVTQTGWPVDNVGGEQIEGFFDSWSAINSYSDGEIVTGPDGNRYEATANNNLNRDPSDPANRPDYWKQIFIIGDWVSTEIYGAGDFVTYDSGLYKAMQAGSNHSPTSSPTYWQRIHNIPVWANNISYLQNDLAIDSSGVIQVSQQNTNLNHNPIGDNGTWWKPLWQVNPALQANILTGGATLSAYRDNFLTDAGTYTFPLANSVPANTKLLVSMLDMHKAFQPTLQRAGSDLFRRAAGTDTSILMNQGVKVSLTFVSNGVNEWWV